MKRSIFCSFAVIVSLCAMEKEKRQWDGQSYEKGSDFQFENAKKALAQFTLSDYKVIVDVGCGSGRTAQYMAEQAPESMVIGFDISESQVEEAKKKLVGQSNLFFDRMDARRFTLPQKANLMTCFAVLPWIEEHKKALQAMASNMAAGGILIGTWASKNPGHPLLLAYDDMKKDPLWEKPLAAMDIGKSWFPVDEETLKMELQEAGLKPNIKAENFSKVFDGREKFIAFLRGLLNRGITDLSQLDHTTQNVFFNTLAEKYLDHQPEKEDKSILYSLEVFLFTAQKPC
jgi:trans-aconitate methyltransferase